MVRCNCIFLSRCFFKSSASPTCLREWCVFINSCLFFECTARIHTGCVPCGVVIYLLCFFYLSLSDYMNATVSPAITILTIDISFISILSDGPLVSLNGSPTVSPTMVALWHGLPLPPKLPSSTIFFALSHAPPALAMNTARVNPVARLPASSPRTPATPSTMPTITGIRIARMAGRTISRCAPRVLISTHRP